MIEVWGVSLHPALFLVLLVPGYGLVYFIWLQVCGVLVASRVRRRTRGVGPATERPEPADFEVFVLVPCRDEELVVGATVEALLAQDPRATVVVIDDASLDATAAIADTFAAQSDRVVVVRRRAPNARLGKGAALNAALEVVRDRVRARSLDPHAVLVGVMDADGILSPGAIGHVARLFDDDAVGGVQLQVRIRNRHRALTRIQDIGFWGTAALAQLGRDATRSVSLGGNGQFTRLAALDEIDGAPWSDSLTEDLDLMISLTIRGWQMRMTPLAHVEQEGPETFRDLLRQRTRWAQGHMQCATRTGEVLRSGRVPHATAAELTCYLWQPWTLALPWSLLSPLLAVLAVRAVVLSAANDGAAAAIGVATAIVLLALVPAAWGAVVYARRAGRYGVARSWWMQLVSVALHLITWLATWRALGRILLGRQGWAKTARVAAQSSHSGPEPDEPARG